MDEVLRRRLAGRLPELTLALDCHRGNTPGGVGLGPDGFALITTCGRAARCRA